MKKPKGGLTVWIDKFTPCLVDTETGEELETVAYQIKDRKELKGYNKKTGWYINWVMIPKECEIYALAVKGSEAIQGLVAVRDDKEVGLPYLHWVCAAPHNRKTADRGKKYEGVGGHLFAVAADISEQWGYNGEMHGFAANADLCKHYIETFGAEYVGQLHKYQIYINKEQAGIIRETYSYEWI
jgi:hypothetical protein